jgi:nucleoside triphosphate pyrophosphatase
MHKLPTIYLASKSPRRKHLLEASAIPFKILAVNVEETYPEELSVEEVPEFLAIKKAAAALEIQPDGIILAADSIVVMDGQIFEKPTNRENAVDIIRSLAGNSHVVITGVCLMSFKKKIHFSDHSVVHLASMTTKEVEWYVDTFEPFDKAGAYGIQDWIGHCKVDRIEGSYNNIMGLPTHRVYEELRRFIRLG